MQEFGLKSAKSDLRDLTVRVQEAHWNLTQAELIEEAIKNNPNVREISRKKAIFAD